MKKLLSLLIALILSAGMGIWGLARVFNIGAKFAEFEQSHDHRADLLIAITAAELKKNKAAASLEATD